MPNNHNITLMQERIEKGIESALEALEILDQSAGEDSYGQIEPLRELLYRAGNKVDQLHIE